MSGFMRQAMIGVIGLCGWLAAACTHAGGNFVPTGTMVSPRTHQGSALLDDGRVFQFGGVADVGVLSNTAEIYDPATGEFRATGSAVDARMRPTTLKLADGRVLVTGGRGGPKGSVIFAAAEIYDPTTGTFSSTGAMTTSRYVASAALLADGKVLVAAGFNFEDGTLGSAELYDPATGQFAATGGLTHARDLNGQAVTLQDGRVFLAGGYNDDGSLDTAELYDPATGTFSLTTDLPEPRGDHVFVLLADGRVLIVAGFDGSWNYAASGFIWDPVTETYAPTGNLNVTRANPSATLLADGRVLIAGGTYSAPGGGDPNAPTAEIYDPATNQFTLAGNLVTPRSHGRANRLDDGRVLLMGGWAGVEDLPTASAELFVPELDDTIFVDGFDAVPPEGG